MRHPLVQFARMVFALVETVKNGHKMLVNRRESVGFAHVVKPLNAGSHLALAVPPLGASGENGHVRRSVAWHLGSQRQKNV